MAVLLRRRPTQRNLPQLYLQPPVDHLTLERNTGASLADGQHLDARDGLEGRQRDADACDRIKQLHTASQIRGYHPVIPATDPGPILQTLRLAVVGITGGDVVDAEGPRIHVVVFPYSFRVHTRCQQCRSARRQASALSVLRSFRPVDTDRREANDGDTVCVVQDSIAYIWQEVSP